MEFEDFLIQSVRRRPDDENWQRQACYALLGLSSEAAQVLDECRRWAADGQLPLGQTLRRRFWGLEFYRALCYYQLDLRPVRTAPSLSGFGGLPETGELLCIEAGRLSSLVSGWLFRRQWLDERAVESLRRFEAERQRLYTVLGVAETDVWAEFLAGYDAGHSPYNTLPSRLDLRPHSAA